MLVCGILSKPTEWEEDQSIIVLAQSGNIRVSVKRSRFPKKMQELYNENDLNEIALQTGLPIQAIRNMTFTAFIKADILDKDVYGWKEYAQVLRREGLDV